MPRLHLLFDEIFVVCSALSLGSDSCKCFKIFEIQGFLEVLLLIFNVVDIAALLFEDSLNIVRLVLISLLHGLDLLVSFKLICSFVLLFISKFIHRLIVKPTSVCHFFVCKRLDSLQFF